MKETDNRTLQSIRTGIWTICGILSIHFGFEYTDVAKTEFGGLTAIIALIAGVMMICYVFYKIGDQIFLKIKEMADEDDNPNQS